MYVPSARRQEQVQSRADVIIVGAGPSGSYSALEVAKTGVEVVVFEEHKEVGLPSHCAGHISIKGLKDLGLRLPPRVIENEISGAVFYSPSGLEFRVRLASPVTYVVNRAMFDQYLAYLAEKSGAKILVGNKVESLLLERGFVNGVSLKNGQEFNSKIVVDAEGCASYLSKQIGLQAFNRSSVVAAVNCEASNVTDVENNVVEVYLGQKYAPGLFAWIIPRRDGSAKVGLATGTGNPRGRLEQFLNEHPIARRKIKRNSVRNPSYHLIPLGGPIPKTYHNGFLAVGDVASQVKPTTGGGVIMGLTCAKIAGETAYEAKQENDFSESFLSRYQQRWQQAIGFDMAVMRRVRLMLNRLSDRKLDKIIELCSELNLNEAFQRIRDIDFQGKALLPIFKSPNAWIVAFYFFLASIM